MFFKKDKSKDTIRVIPLGGQDGVGMNCWIYEHDKTRIMLDCGVSVGDDSTADQILPDVSYLEGKKLDAILLTHWHVDHINAIPYLYEQMGRPVIYGTPFTIAKLQRTADEDFPKIGKLKTKIIPAEGKRVKIGSIEAEFIHSTHHTPQSAMIALRCSTGTLLHTGDWALNPNPNVEGPTNEKALKDLNKENFLGVIGDSTEIYRKEITHGEAVVGENLLKYFKMAKKKIIVPLFSSTIGRLQTVYENAQKVGREVCLLGRSVETNAELAKECGFLQKCNFITLDQARGLGEDQIVYISTGCQGEPMAALPRILKKQYKGITLNKNDMVIFSSSVIPGNEKDILELYNKVIEQGATLVTVSDDIVHSHGHGGLQEFIRFYGELVKPKYLIPTHGDSMSKFQHAELAKKYGVKDALHIRNGDVVEFTADGAPAIVEQVDAGAVAVEGPFRISLKDPIFKNRSKVYHEGAVIVSLPLDKKGMFTGIPVVSSLGFFETTGGEFIQKEVVMAITKEVKNLPVKDARNRTTLNQTINAAVRKTVKPYFSPWKRPKIVIHFVEV
ncbi:MAG: ribonuclease J [Alphaproteobacteria bacterium]|nr:ribonuclease J [Alphaproteobacteria bacterium]MBN2779824.1 ribonuclease J [Alphaproteobacteria bacterium]